jgi:hypothetical protein
LFGRGREPFEGGRREYKKDRKKAGWARKERMLWTSEEGKVLLFCCVGCVVVGEEGELSRKMERKKEIEA